jgi:hypothetical protein
MASLVLTAATLGGTTAITPTDQSGAITLTLPSTGGTLQTSGAGFTTNGVAYATSTSALTTGSALQFDGSNLGVGVTPSSWATYKAIDVLGYASFSSYNGNEADMSSNAYYNAGWKYKNTAAATLYQQDTGVHRWQYAASGTAGNAITWTAAMTLTNAGALCIGTTTSTGGCTLNVSSTNSNTISNTYIWNAQDGGLFLRNGSSTTNTAVGITMFGGAGNNSNAAVLMVQETGNSLGALAFFTGGSGRSSTVPEAGRFDSSGNLLVGTTSTVYSEKLGVNQTNTTSGNYAGFFNNANGSTNNGIRVTIGNAGNNTSTWHYAGSTAGVNTYYLYGNGTTSYSSDERLKKNIQSTRDGYLEDVCKLRVVKYQWLGDDQDCQQVELGLIAQEVEAVFPRLIQEHEIEGVGIRKNVKQSVLPFILLKSIQELSALVTAQSATITSLTERITALEGK